MNVDTPSKINTLSICSGVGGLDLGLELATGGAARAVCFVEREAFPAAILASRMEDKTLAEAPIWSDLRTFDGKPWRGVVDLITGGYPCQPFSSAGKRLGEDDSRHLWPEIRRIIEEIKPRFVFFENVAGHLTLGLADVLGDLARLGFRYSAGLFTAEEVGAPHRRERLFILGVSGVTKRRNGRQSSRTTGTELADSDSERLEVGVQCNCEKIKERQTPRRRDAYGCDTDVANPECNRSQGDCDPWSTQGSARRSSGAVFPPGPADLEQWRRILEADPRLSPAIESQKTEPGVRRMDDGMASRVDRLRACGNGVVPLVAAYAFTTLLACIEE